MPDQMTICDRLCDLSTRISQTSTTATIVRLWHQYLTIALVGYFRFNKPAAHAIFEWGADGHNWKALWKENSPEFADAGKQRLLTAFRAEAEYIADRITMDRLLRCHWLFNQWRLHKPPKKDELP